jgi:hypothetical protein
MTISNDDAILQRMLSTMETLRADQLRLAEQVSTSKRLFFYT